jgi:hypothetical protein
MLNGFLQLEKGTQWRISAMILTYVKSIRVGQNKTSDDFSRIR